MSSGIIPSPARVAPDRPSPTGARPSSAQWAAALPAAERPHVLPYRPKPAARFQRMPAQWTGTFVAATMLAMVILGAVAAAVAF